MFKAACIQLNNKDDLDENLAAAEGFVRAAVREGASLILTPENSCRMCHPVTKKLANAELEEESLALKFYKSLAKELGVEIIIGSLSIKLEKRKLANRSYVIGTDGEIISSYDKIHLFDVDLPNGERYRESAVIQPGDKAVVAQASAAQIGLSICYDVRFSHLYRDMAKSGAQILSIPAAFSMPTGEAHWETLLRARAIETGSFVLAAGQEGVHDGGRECWGHSRIIGPWGDIRAGIDTGQGYIIAEIDLEDVTAARASIPALEHDRDYQLQDQ